MRDIDLAFAVCGVVLGVVMFGTCSTANDPVEVPQPETCVPDTIVVQESLANFLVAPFWVTALDSIYSPVRPVVGFHGDTVAWWNLHRCPLGRKRVTVSSRLSRCVFVDPDSTWWMTKGCDGLCDRMRMGDDCYDDCAQQFTIRKRN